MILRVIYEEMGNGKIRATIRVKDKEDYPSKFIFDFGLVYPADIKWSLATGGYKKVYATFPTWDEAKAWVDLQINALKKHLDNWRKIKISKMPKIEEYWI